MIEGVIGFSVSIVVFASLVAYTCGRNQGKRDGLSMAQMMIAGYVFRKYNVLSTSDISSFTERREAEKLLQVIGFD